MERLLDDDKVGKDCSTDALDEDEEYIVGDKGQEYRVLFNKE